mmetsp:Transcript_24096/g.52087  ORF Transcript_24096/g.52087 Transcript_24096/m.52087 type:complete len:302 (-) Transcript_24096:2236-3141(-)
MLSRSFPITILLYLAAVEPLIAMTTACSSNRLLNQRVLITGGGRGIGRALALICSREGAKVAITSRTRSELEETASHAAAAAASDQSSDGSHSSHELQPKMSIHIADVTNVSEVEDTVKSIVEKWGGIDVLINNAGGSQKSKGSLENLSSDDLRSILDLNVVSVHAVTSAVLRHAMLPAGGGRIVNISSRAGKVGLPNVSHYCASKFALEGMTAALAEEVKDKGIEVNTLSPGMVNTMSFPKPEGKKGVRSAASVEDSLFALLEGGVTGHYVHADELDEVRTKGLEDEAALKPIREAMFSP